MRHGRYIALAVALTLTIAAPSYAAAPKAGAKCAKKSTTANSAGKIFTCIQSGKKLVWNKGVSIEKPTPVVTPSPTRVVTATPTPIPTLINYKLTDPNKFKPPTECRLISNTQASEHYGFPRPANLIPTIGQHKSIALFVYFDDLPFEQRQFDEWRNNQIPTLETYLMGMSYGKLKYKVDIFNRPIHIKKSVLTYNLDTAHDAPMKSNANAGGLVSDAVTASDAEVDFSEYEFINVITPWTRLIGFEGTTGVRLTADGKKFNFASFGPIREYLDDPTKKIWLLHEVGHMMGLIHQFNIRRDWGRTGYPIWSAMANGTSPLPEFMAWEKFLLGWFSDGQVRCIENFEQGPFTSKLTSLSASDDGAKTILVRQSANQILVIESRRTSALGILSKEEEGVLVYTIDTSVRSNEGAADLVFNSAKTRRMSNGGGGLIGTLQAGEIVTSRGVKVEVLYSDKSGDIIRVSKG
jgi:M6 family metalloprotease-like protein